MEKHFFTLLLLFEIFIFSFPTSGQTQNDTITAKGLCHYTYHINLKPQDGYGLVLGFLGSEKVANDLSTTRSIYKVGIAKTKHDYNEAGIGYASESVALEINRIKNKTFYGFLIGLDTKSLFLDMGLNLNYITGFGNSRALSIRPQFGISFFNSFNLDAIVAYDIYPLKANFDYVSHWIFGLQYTIGILEHN